MSYAANTGLGLLANDAVFELPEYQGRQPIRCDRALRSGLPMAFF